MLWILLPSKFMEERNNTVLIWYKCIWAPALVSSLEKIFDYPGPVCSVFISFTSTGLVLNCHCPKAHEIEMNCCFLHSLTVKYLGSLSPIILMCVFDSPGMTSSISAAWHFFLLHFVCFAVDYCFHSHVYTDAHGLYHYK